MKFTHKSLYKISVKKSFFFFLFSVSLILQTSMIAYAAAFCITDPWGWPGDPFDNRCPVNTSITPSPSSVSSGSSVGVRIYAWTLYQWFENGLQDVDASMTNTVSGAYSSLYIGPPSTVSTVDQVVSTGPLTNSVSLSISAMSTQGIIEYDSSFITVTSAPPTVNINFSLLDKLNNFFTDLFATKVFAAE